MSPLVGDVEMGQGVCMSVLSSQFCFETKKVLKITPNNIQLSKMHALVSGSESRDSTALLPEVGCVHHPDSCQVLLSASLGRGAPWKVAQSTTGRRGYVKKEIRGEKASTMSFQS